MNLDMPFTAKVQRAFADGGAKTVVTRTLRKMVRPVVKMGSVVLTECDLSTPFSELQPVPGIIARQATIEDAKLFEDPTLFLERFHEGHRCFMGIEDETGRLTNYRWVNTSAAYIPEIDRHLILKPGEAYIYDLNTLPEFRRRGIDAYTRQYTYSYLRDSGFTKIYAYILGNNYPSLQASRRLLNHIGRLWYIQMRGCKPMILGGRRRGFPELIRLRSHLL